MFDRIYFKALLVAGLAIYVAGCSNTGSGLDSISVTPTTSALTIGGTDLQLTATGTFGNGSHPTTQNLTGTVTWVSNAPNVAQVTSSGLVSPVSAGQAQITASAAGYDGTVTSSVTITVSGTSGGTSGTGGTGTGTQEPLLSISVVPDSVSVSNIGMTAQFLAFGTFSATPTVRDLTNQVTWISSLPEVASVNSTGAIGEDAGVATAMGYTGTSTIFAESINPDGTVVLSNPETFTCKDPITNVCDQTVVQSQFATLTVFDAGENTTTWLVTAPTDTGVPNLIHCGPGAGTSGSVCTGTYETGSTVVLTESPTGSGFGGWSSGDGVSGINCQPAPGTTLLNSPTCTVTLTGNASIGVIFY